jgi:hypothetical protein
MGSGAPDVMLILSDIGKMGEIAEGTDDSDSLLRREVIEEGFEFASRCFVVVAVKADGGLPNPFDHLKSGCALLIPDRITKYASEEPNIIA